ncbi:MAG: hypothetical protein DRP42_06285 [Tenericutes bacterium]|nr:MAG: hypothetical protein DRP42_06285 [Mycoplasmatota bacterium]
MEICMTIRLTRKKRGYTLDHLADLTGLSKGYLSKIERAKEPPPFSTLETIAKALDEDMTLFFKTVEQRDLPHNIDVMKVKDTRLIKAEGGYDYRPLVNSFKNKAMSPLLMEVAQGSTKRLKHDGEEFVYVVRGKVELLYENETHALTAGDSFYLDSRIRHCFTNHGPRKAVLLAVHFQYRRF